MVVVLSCHLLFNNQNVDIIDANWIIQSGGMSIHSKDQERADEIPWWSVPSPTIKHEKDIRHLLSSQALHFDTSIAKYLKDTTVIAMTGP